MSGLRERGRLGACVVRTIKIEHGAKRARLNAVLPAIR